MGMDAALNEEVPEPGRPIAEQRHGQQPPPALRDDRPDQHQRRGDGAEIVNDPRCRSGMLTQVERPEIGIVREAGRHGRIVGRLALTVILSEGSGR